MIATVRLNALAAALGAALLLAAPAAMAQDTVVARVNGKTLTENDIRLAEAEIGGDLGNLPDATRRRVLVEFLIENQLLADAAEGAKLGSGADFDQRMQYFKRRALREAYFEKTIRDSVSDAEAKRFYDEQVGGQKGDEEVRARHILVESEIKAKEVFEKIGHGAEFAQMAKEFSRDPGSKDNGGDLGYFGRGQMVPQFEEAAFKLKPGDVSLPVQSQFGWHLIKLEDKRQKKPPAYEAVKDRIVAALIHRKAQETVNGMRSAAKIEYLDAEIKRQIEEQKAAGGKQ